MIVCMKSTSLKEADDVIEQILHMSAAPFSVQLFGQPSAPVSIFCEWILSGRIDMDFTNNLS